MLVGVFLCMCGVFGGFRFVLFLCGVFVWFVLVSWFCVVVFFVSLFVLKHKNVNSGS